MYQFRVRFKCGKREADNKIQVGYLQKENCRFGNVPDSFLSQSPHYINEKFGPKK